MRELRQAVVKYASMHANSDGIARTPIEGLRMMWSFAPGAALHSIYRPLVCFILQGAKQLEVAGETRVFGAGQAVVVTVDVPVTGRIVTASLDAPYLAVAVELQMTLLHELAAQMAPARRMRDVARTTLFAEDADAAALECTMRLMRLLDRIEDAPVLQPGILRELHYWLLCGRHGEVLRTLASPDGFAQRLSEAIRILRAEFRCTLRVERLAAASNMSTAAFHRHFKSMTSLTPGQFQKQLRLIEARRLMVDEGFPASVAASRVGYESVPQFTREYRRMFGVPPATHARRLNALDRPLSGPKAETATRVN